MEEAVVEKEYQNLKIEDIKEIMQEKKNLLTVCLKKISTYIDELQETENTENIFLILEKVKKALDAVGKNIDLLDKKNKTVDFKEIHENELIIADFFKYYIEFCCLDMNKKIIEEPKDKLPQKEESIKGKSEKEESEKEIQEVKIKQQQEEIKDNNTLIISETQNKVILPYKVEELKSILEKNKNKYYTLQDAINYEFTVPLSKYKNVAIARFREAFNLMRNKEKASLYKSFDLGIELMWNSLLNPAVITACKNLDELDIYLDYLDSNEIEKFKIFDVKYEIAPMVKK